MSPAPDDVLMMRASTASPALSSARARTRPRDACTREVALQMNPDDRVELLFARREEHAVADEAHVVDEDVEPAERFERGLHESARAFPLGDVAGIRGGFAARGPNLVDDLLRGPGVVRTGSVACHTQIVHHDTRPFRREGQRVRTADPAPRAGHDDNSSLTQSCHGCVPYRRD